MGKFSIILILVILLSGCTQEQEKISNESNFVERHSANDNYKIERMSNGVFIYSDNIQENTYSIID